MLTNNNTTTSTFPSTYYRITITITCEITEITAKSVAEIIHKTTEKEET